MDVLVLGGTVFLGRAVVDAALGRGDRVTIFHRGRHPAHRPGEVEELRGDRDGGLGVLAGRRWDVVVDTSGYVPRLVRDSAASLARCGAYVFVSSGSVYADLSPPLDEGRAVHQPVGTEAVTAESYGPLKVGCEQAVVQAFPGSALIVRAGLIVGPWDGTNRFTYWVTRLADGGRVLAPGVPEQPVQVVDVRDLASFLLSAAGREGVVNVAGPFRSLTFGGLLERCSPDAAELVWVDEGFLLERGVEPWGGLPLWLPASSGLLGMLDQDDRLARGMGAAFRPIEQTIADTLAWARSAPPARGLDVGVGVLAAGITRQREAELLDAWDRRP